MEERDKEQLEQTAGSEEDIVMSPKRGRGRPKNEEPDSSTTAESQETGRREDRAEDAGDSRPSKVKAASAEEQVQDYLFSEKGIQIIAELVKSQNEAQANMIRAQTEFSNQVMDRMDNYRMQIATLQSESAEKERAKLQSDILSAQDRLDEYQENIHQLRLQIDLLNRDNMKLTNKNETLIEQNESLRQQVKALKNQCDTRQEKEAEESPTQKQVSQISFPQEGWIKRRRRRRFLKKVLESTDFSDDQKEVIRKADARGIPFEMLVQICNPAIQAANMERMITYSKEG